MTRSRRPHTHSERVTDFFHPIAHQVQLTLFGPILPDAVVTELRNTPSMVDIVLSRFEFNLRACFSSNLLQNLKTPGPGQYAPEMVDAVFRKAPSYSLSARTTGNLTQSSPGPAAYVLSEQIGSNVKTKTSAPAYSMSSRYGSFSEGMAIFSFQFLTIFRFEKDSWARNI